MTIVLSEHYPKIIKDFYLYDESASDGSAHQPIDLPFEIDRSALLVDAKKLPWDMSHAIRRFEIVKREDDVAGTDRTLNNRQPVTAQIDFNEFKAIGKLINDLNSIGPVTYMSFKNMLPGEYLEPHMDSLYGPLSIYIPITWPSGCYFKVYKQGFVDFSDLKPNIVDTGGHVHSVINDSNEERYTFSFYCDWQSPGWNKILAGTKINYNN